MYTKILMILVLFLGGEKSFSAQSETASSVPLKVEKIKRTSVVFIAGYDEGENAYYSHAKRYFETKGIQVIASLFSMEEIITWLHKNSEPHTQFDKIHIVSHSNEWLGMSLKTTKKGERITQYTLAKALMEGKILKAPNSIDSETKVIFHSCGLGENRLLMQELKNVFTAIEAPEVYATSFFNVFGGKFADHYLAKPYYTFYPTAESPGPLQLSKEIETTYPNTKIDWFRALKTRKETAVGAAYSYKFNIPVSWQFTFDDIHDIPKFKTKEALLDWISESSEMAALLFELGIPIEKYRWQSKIQANKLHIKGKTTVLCVLLPILEANDHYEYQKIAVENPKLYKKI